MVNYWSYLKKCLSFKVYRPKARPVNSHRQLTLAVSYYVDGKYKKALSNVDIAISMMPHSSAAYQVRASIYKKLGNTDLAELDERKAFRLAEIIREQS